MSEQPAKMGRPSSYTPELAERLCAHLAGGKALRSACRLPGMPRMTTVYRWMREHEEFRSRYARACEDRTDAMAEEILAIANTPVEGVIEKMEPVPVRDADGAIKRDEQGNEVTELRVVERRREDMIAHRRLQIDTRKWLMGKLKPKKYGEKLDVDVSGKMTLEQLVAAAAVIEKPKEP